MGSEGCKWGIIPDYAALASFIWDLSIRFYDGRYLPGRSLYDDKRPQDWRMGAPILRAYKLPQTAEGWRQLMEFLGFSLAVAPYGARYAIQSARRHATEWDAPNEPMPKLTDTSCGYGEGLEVIVRMRPVRVWCLRTHRYITVGHRRVLEVR
jgi:hypothetical protein